MNRQFRFYGLLALTTLFVLACASSVAAVSWSAFKEAEFSGITIDKPVEVDVLDYTITIGEHPTIAVDGQTHELHWIQAFYLISETPGGKFVAANGAGNTWNWDSKTNDGGQISGWHGQGNNRIHPGGAETFHFSQLDPQDNPLIAGFHVSYDDGKNAVTGWYSWRNQVQAAMVPEPSSLLSFGVASVGFLGLTLRRRRTRN